MVCSICYNSNFRLSRLRRTDVATLLTFHYPVRCRTCSHRMQGSFLFALQLRQNKRRKRSLADSTHAH